MNLFFLIWLAVSLTGSAMMIIDKHSAISNKKRISEKTLILTACFGAALLMWITMYLIHHKTKHLLFSAGLPVILTVQFVIAFLILN